MVLLILNSNAVIRKQLAPYVSKSFSSPIISSIWKPLNYVARNKVRHRTAPETGISKVDVPSSRQE